ncbi:pentatricopeptide repeat-containing protein At5g27270 isoform X2 [Phalaenopsis equestris]|uniref:pentatricopeptide repeat-containing protein At5g27270 isoform X2 n=1 Tax=Phalaenopsis equestris TaxID=78828 RepID=UPI0009E1946B|nr:pentatricopeptide repeat-containing protein At5g27270 isoform X2 [Phalaenopsis equestris]
MDSIHTSFLPPLLPSRIPPSKSQCASKPYNLNPIHAATRSPTSWTLSDGNSRGTQRKTRKAPPNFHPRKPLSDDDARRIIHEKAQYLRRLRRNQGPLAEIPRWIRRTPEQMARLVQDGRLEGQAHGRHVVAAIKAVRSLAGRPEGSYDMREVMGSFVAKLSFREMCVVLREQRGWRQARDFFAWMKLQLCYKPSVMAYTILLRTYGQVGKIQLAEKLFLEMLECGCEPDEVACGTMLCAYARWGRQKPMMTFYSAVRRREILPSIAVFNFMMSSFHKQKIHSSVIQLWKQILEAGLEPNGFTYTLAIHSFGKKGLLDDALGTFVKMKKVGFVPEESTYSMLIILTAKNGREDEALRLYEEMKPQGIIPSVYTLASVLALHYKNDNYAKALSMFSEMERNKIVPDEVIYGILVRIYGKLRLYDDAQRTFEDVDELGLLTHEKTYVAMAQVHLNAGNFDKALDVLNLMRSRNVELSKFSYCALLRCYVAKEDVGAAESTFRTLCRSESPDAICYNGMLILYLKLGLLEKAKGLVSEIKRYEVPFDGDLYRTVLQVYCRERMVIDAEQLVDQMHRSGMAIDNRMKMLLITLYGEVGALHLAENLLKTVEQPDVALLGVMLCSYLKNGDAHKASEMLKSLLETTNGLSIASRLMIKLAKEGCFVEMKWILERSVDLGFGHDDAAIASVINLYGQNQQLKEALEIYKLASRSTMVDKIVYVSMIDAYCKCHEVDEAELLYKKMIEKGLTPDAVVISILVNAFSKHGMFQNAERLIYGSFDTDTVLDTVAYNTYIKAMLDSGKLHLAIDIYDRMIDAGVRPSLQTYNTMISVYGRGKSGKAIEMFDAAHDLCPSIDEKLYTNMISYYGKWGRIQDASLLFNKMKEGGIKPGKKS